MAENRNFPHTPNEVVAYNLRRAVDEARELGGWTLAEAGRRIGGQLGKPWTAANLSMSMQWGGGRVRHFSIDEVAAFARAFGKPVVWFLMPPEDMPADAALVPAGVDVEERPPGWNLRDSAEARALQQGASPTSGGYRIARSDYDGAAAWLRNLFLAGDADHGQVRTRLGDTEAVAQVSWSISDVDAAVLRRVFEKAAVHRTGEQLREAAEAVGKAAELFDQLQKATELADYGLGPGPTVDMFPEED